MQNLHTLAQVFCGSASIPQHEALYNGIKTSTINEIRQENLDQIELVKPELGISKELESRWHNWIDQVVYGQNLHRLFTEIFMLATY